MAILSILVICLTSFIGNERDEAVLSKVLGLNSSTVSSLLCSPRQLIFLTCETGRVCVRQACIQLQVTGNPTDKIRTCEHGTRSLELAVAGLGSVLHDAPEGKLPPLHPSQDLLHAVSPHCHKMAAAILNIMS